MADPDIGSCLDKMFDIGDMIGEAQRLSILPIKFNVSLQTNQKQYLAYKQDQGLQHFYNSRKGHILDFLSLNCQVQANK